MLVEHGGRGHTEHFTETTIDSGVPGAIVLARITGRTASSLIAAVLPEAA